MQNKKRNLHLSEEHSRVIMLFVPALLLSTGVLISLPSLFPAATKLASQEFNFCVTCPLSITVRPNPFPVFLGLVIMLLV